MAQPETDTVPDTVAPGAGASMWTDGVALIVKVAAADVAPPGFTTVTLAVPAEPIRAAGTEAVNSAALTKLVDSAAPFHSATAPETKFAPFTVSVNAAPPDPVDAGLRLEMAGGGDTDAGMTSKLWLGAPADMRAVVTTVASHTKKPLTRNRSSL